MCFRYFFALSTFVVFVRCDGQDDGKALRIILNDGNFMPSLGLQTFLDFDKGNNVRVLVTKAIEAGYRLFDTAQAYNNEGQVGLAVETSSVPRENIFIVTKLASNRKNDPVAALRDSLQKMNLSYVDLYLIHNPVSFTRDWKSFDVIDYVHTWVGMEETKKLALAKSIGISNFNILQIKRLLANCEILPSVLQVEVNLNLAQTQLVEFCKSKNIAVMAYSPFGGLYDDRTISPPPKIDDPKLNKIANKHGKTVPQIILRYLLQRGLVPIPPQYVKTEKIEDNINVFDFKLTSREMKALNKFNINHRTVNPSYWQDHPYYPFEKNNVIFKTRNRYYKYLGFS